MTTQRGRCAAESVPSGPGAGPEPVIVRSDSCQRIGPSIARACGSSRSLEGLKRWPDGGTPGPMRAVPVTRPGPCWHRHAPDARVVARRARSVAPPSPSSSSIAVAWAEKTRNVVAAPSQVAPSGEVLLAGSFALGIARTITRNSVPVCQSRRCHAARHACTALHCANAPRPRSGFVGGVRQSGATATEITGSRPTPMSTAIGPNLLCANYLRSAQELVDLWHDSRV